MTFKIKIYVLENHDIKPFVQYTQLIPVCLDAVIRIALSTQVNL